MQFSFSRDQLIQLIGTEKSGWYGPHPNQYGEGKGKGGEERTRRQEFDKLESRSQKIAKLNSMPEYKKLWRERDNKVRAYFKAAGAKEHRTGGFVDKYVFNVYTLRGGEAVDKALSELRWKHREIRAFEEKYGIHTQRGISAFEEKYAVHKYK